MAGANDGPVPLAEQLGVEDEPAIAREIIDRLLDVDEGEEIRLPASSSKESIEVTSTLKKRARLAKALKGAGS